MVPFKRLVIIGGHLAPALAVIEEIRRRGGWDVFWLGRRFAMEEGKVPALEYEVIKKLGIPFFVLATGRLQRPLSIKTIFSLLRVIPGFFMALFTIARLRPDVVLSFGGYLSFPVVFACYILRIPILIHEQTTTSGLANRIAAYFAKKIAISFPSSILDFPREKVILTGNPIRRTILKIKRKSPKIPLIYVTGGSQGSQTINRALSPILSKLIKRFSIIHQTGFIDYKRFLAKKKKLGRRYRFFSVTGPEEVARIYQSASLVISRAGANTVSELAAAGLPGILIPIPWSERGEQEKNARLLEETGLVRVLPQDKLTSSGLFGMIVDMTKNPPSQKSRNLARKLIIPDASRRLVDLLEYLAD